MTSVWKRLQRVNKRAAKFQFTASYHRVDVEITSKWKPNKLSVVWSRRSRRVVAEPLDWEPSLMEPLKGSAIWAVPDNHNIAVTLFRDQRTNELEDKDWIFILEDVASSGRRRKIAQVPINLKPLATAGPSQKCLSLQMKPCTAKVTAASIEVTISSVLLREGSAADEDMQSMASMMSMNNNSDIAPLDDFEEDSCSISDNSVNLQQMMNLTQQMELMTSSLTGTPGSPSSLSVTPIAMAPSDLFKIDPSERGEPYTLNEYQRPYAVPFLANSTPISKHNLKPLDLKTNLNDYMYSKDADDDLNSEVTPIVDNGKTVQNSAATDPKMNRLKLNKEPSFDDGTKDATPAHDLLEWCKDATKDYPQCNVVNLSSSWVDGVAFCAIINHFRPDLIDMLDVCTDDPEANIRMAHKASTALGVPGILLPSELKHSKGPDRLALLTYLHQLRALFTNRQLRLSKIGQTTGESSYVIGNFNTDKNSDISVELFSQEILSMRQKNPNNNNKARTSTRNSVSSQDSTDSQKSQERILSGNRQTRDVTSPGRISQGDNVSHKEKSPINNVKDVKDMIVASSKSFLGRVLSPTKETLQNFKMSFEGNNKPAKDANDNNRESKKDTSPPAKVDAGNGNQPPAMGITVREAWPVKLMTRKQLTDPFGSDDEDDPPQCDKISEISNIQSEKKDDVETKDINETLQSATSNEALSNSAQSKSFLSPLDSLQVHLMQMYKQLLSRHDELKERARKLLEATRQEAREKESARIKMEQQQQQQQAAKNRNRVKEQNGSVIKNPEDARKEQLRERARKLIADARAGLITSPTSPGSRGGTVEVLNASQILAEQQMLGNDFYMPMRNRLSGGTPEKDIDLIKNRSDIDAISLKDEKRKGSPLRDSFDKPGSPLHIMDRISPDKDSFIMKGFGKDMRNFIQNEMEALEREQSAIDAEASILEKKLRAVMESGQSDEQENALMVQWFTLVNKKNALLRRQMQLNILEQENELRVRHAKVDNELRKLLTVEEWRKSEGQRGDEARLLRELLTVVEARDQLVHHLHEHEQAMEDDDEIERNLSNVDIKKKNNNCFVQ